MHAYVYKSLKKADTYVYLAGRDDFARLPEPVRSQLGTLQFVLDVDLSPERKLARGDAMVVRENLVARGFHLQFPPYNDALYNNADPMTDDWGTDA
ncbi:MAG: YcgL domain-containing protein [Luteimonas sp.]